MKNLYIKTGLLRIYQECLFMKFLSVTVMAPLAEMNTGTAGTLPSRHPTTSDLVIHWLTIPLQC